jgi:hypothetical protein
MTDIRVGLPTLLIIVAVVGAGAFAAGRSWSPPETSAPPAAPVAAMPLSDDDDMLPPGHPPTGALGDLPDPSEVPESSLTFSAPARWQLVPNASTMRLATYRVPRAPGDSEDAELSITQAGGSVDANAERWIGQFDPAARKTAKRATRKVGQLEVTTVEVHGTYSPGMGGDASSGEGRALLGAIVDTPGMPHFFKLTGPVKTVQAARAEFEAMIASVALR